ncbi:hypothetical protein DFJ73DRAFT_872813 [Zopfochytrium polystomum]|nr:hypothetical protein DFJ73DRAFT_872813 [Zopfochytrium polystomum]
MATTTLGAATAAEQAGGATAAAAAAATALVLGAVVALVGALLFARAASSARYCDDDGISGNTDLDLTGAPLPSAKMVAAKAAKHRNEPFPSDKVVLHLFPRPPDGWGIPTMSPYIAKLEMYLRITGTPYDTDFTLVPSFKGGMPYITYNGVQVPDSHFAIEWLERNGITTSPDVRLHDADKGLVEAYRQLLVSLSDLLAMWRWINPANASFAQNTLFCQAPVLVRPFIYRDVHSKATKRFRLAGLLSHSRDELVSLADRQLAALSSLLESRQDEHGRRQLEQHEQLADEPAPIFLLGTREPTTLDCAAFGVLSQYVVAGHPRVHAAAVASAAARGDPAASVRALGVPLSDRAIMRGVTPALVRYVRRVAGAWFGEFAEHIDEETWAGLEAEAAAEAAEGQRR